MRKTRYTILLHAAALLLLAVSCGREELPRAFTSALEGFENIELEDNCIMLRLDPSAAGVRTKAATERGEDELNENHINTLDCFFFRTGEADSPAIFRAIGRTVEDAVSDSTECYVKIYYNDDIARVLFGSTTEGTCDVFVIANASINYDASSTLNQLRQSVLEYDFSQQEVQPYFTMCSCETSQVTLYSVIATVNGENKQISTAAARVPLYRCAAKAQLYLKLPETFADGVDNSLYAPRPDALGGIQIKLYSGVKKTYADAEYEVTASDYIHFEDRDMSLLTGADLVEGKEEYNYGHTPFYSYPMSWTDLDANAANFIFSIPWQLVKDAEGNDVENGVIERRYYKISANVTGRKFEANGFYRTFVYIQSRGAEELDKAEDVDECWYIITPWIHEGVAAANGAESISGEFVRYSFLVVEPDEVTLNNEANYTFKFSSSSDLKDYKVVIDSVCFYKYNTGVGVRQQRAVNDSEASDGIDGNEYSVTYNYEKGEIYFSHELEEVYEQRDIYLTVTNKDNISQKVTIHQKPAIMLELHGAGDVFVNGRFGRVANGGSFGTNLIGNGNRYITNGNYYHCTTDFSYLATVNNSYYYNYLNTAYGSIIVTTDNMGSGIADVYFTTEINISAFNSNNHTYFCNGVETEYRIGDPRVKASANASDGGYGSGWSLVDYLYNNNGSEATRAWNNSEDILICSMREEDRNLIAPRFLISSALNANYSLTWEQAVKRGATYQEVGYPAGRWRLPTEAEMAYIVSRQLDSTIPGLYATGSGTKYWAGSGRLMTTDNTGNNTFSDDDGAIHSCRFVYDLWYWDDTPAASNEYHPNGHNTTY